MKLLMASSVLFALSVAVVAQPKPWTVPAEYKTKKNPVAQSDESTKAGLSLYTKNCASCHGKTGLGDGVKARALKEFPGDFSKADFRIRPTVNIFINQIRKRRNAKIRRQTFR